MPLHFVKSTRGKDHILHDGYRFVMDKKMGDKTTWNCIKRRHNNCVARLHTSLDGILHYKNDHNHVPDAATIRAKQILAELKQSAANTSDTPLSIVATKTAGISSPIAARLPSVGSMKRMIQRKRQTTCYPLPVPHTLDALNIPHEYTRTFGNDNFLIFDSGAGPQRILIFGTDRNLELMARSNNWFADGTFKAAPALFYQVDFHLRIRLSDY